MPRSLFVNYPSGRGKKELKKSKLILCNTHNVSSSFLSMYRTSSAPEKEDLLRAMLVFASSGLDSMVKQMVRDCLKDIIMKPNLGAHQQFVNYIKTKLKKDEKMELDFISKILAENDPKNAILEEYVKDLTSGSMQSYESLSKITAAFDINTDLVINNRIFLKQIFEVRNKISHEMDIDFTSRTGSTRNVRSETDMIAYTNEIFKIAKQFLDNVSSKL